MPCGSFARRPDEHGASGAPIPVTAQPCDVHHRPWASQSGGGRRLVPVTRSRAKRGEPGMNARSERTAGTAQLLARGGRMDSATEAFVAHRILKQKTAYEMLGSAADAEDVLQEAWLRWVGVDLDAVRDQRAFLVRITTRLAL